MWEAIENNRRRSRILIALMGLLLMVLGYFIGAFIDFQVSTSTGMFSRVIGVYDQMTKVAEDPINAPVPTGQLPPDWLQQDAKESALRSYRGGLIGVGLAVLLWLGLWALAHRKGERLILRSAGAWEISRSQAPQLFNVVEEMTIAAGLSHNPRVYMIERESPNAFAIGRTPETAAIAVTSGLLKRLTRDELQGVIGHEIGHVKNLDVRFMTIATVILGCFTMTADLLLGRRLSGRSRRDARPLGTSLTILVPAMIASLIGSAAARLLYCACSRHREYLADASAAVFTRYPDGLASALERIAARGFAMRKAGGALAPLFIVNPQQKHRSRLFATHPPTEQRIRILRSMGGRTAYVDYEAAFRSVMGEQARCIPRNTLEDSASTAARPSADSTSRTRGDAIARARETAAVLDQLANISSIACACGVALKIPAHFRRSALRCPRCGRNHDVPRRPE